jgi:hypothetical protein
MPSGLVARIVGRMRHAPTSTTPSLPARPQRLRLRVGAMAMLALVVFAASACGVFGGSDDESSPPAVEVTEEIIACDAATVDAGPVPSIDMGAIVVSALADAERVPVDGGIEIPFVLEIEALDPDDVGDEAADAPVDPSSLAILQARTAEDVAVLLRADAVAEAGADRPGPASALSFERCAEPVRHQVTLLVTAPGCLVLVANDPATGGFTELPVRVEVDECTATPPPAPVG